MTITRSPRAAAEIEETPRAKFIARVSAALAEAEVGFAFFQGRDDASAPDADLDIAVDPAHLSTVDALLRSGRLGLWWASVPQQYWPEEQAARQAIARLSDPVWGDRRQELVFIGADPMDEAWIRAELDACLLKDKSFQPDRWRDLPDPFASWSPKAA